jgi:hypothetical protein
VNALRRRMQSLSLFACEHSFRNPRVCFDYRIHLMQLLIDGGNFSIDLAMELRLGPRLGLVALASAANRRRQLPTAPAGKSLRRGRKGKTWMNLAKNE